MNAKISFFLFISIFFLNNINSKRKLNEEELSDDIIILHTNDVHCGIMDSIGYDGLNLYRKQLERKYKHVLLVDAGDHIQGGAIGLLSRGEDIINIINYLNYSVVTIGNHEFDYKVEQLFNLSKIINTKYICSNFILRKDNSTIFDPYKIVKVGNVSIGFIGVITPQTLAKSYLHNLVDENGTLVYDFLTDSTGQKLYDRVQAYIDELKDEKNVTYVIIVSHMGYGGDASEQYTSPALLAHINRVDAIIDGHTHLTYTSIFPDKDGNNISVSQTGTKLNYIGQLTIKTNGTIISEMINNVTIFDDFDDYNLSYHVENRSGFLRYVDNDTNTFLKSIMDSHSKEFNEKVGYVDFDLLVNTKEGGRISRDQENTLCDLVADAFRYYGNSDIAFIVSGNVKDNLNKGNITFSHVLNILPYSSNVIIKNVSGKDILDALELGMSKLPIKAAKFSQISGMKFKVDDSIKSPVVIDDKENFVKVEGERRVYDVYIGGKKLDENKSYTITMGDFLADGGDGYAMFSQYEMINDTFMLDNEILKQYIATVLNGTIPEIYKNPQGRIVKMKKTNGSNYFNKNFKELTLLLLFIML